MGDERYQAEEDALEGKPADAGADAAGSEQGETTHQADRVDGVEKGGHVRSDQQHDEGDNRERRGTDDELRHATEPIARHRRLDHADDDS